jgi:lysozyme family protein
MHRALLDGIEYRPAAFRLDRAVERWHDGRDDYQRIGDMVGIPGEVIWALHWRESAGRLDTHLHNGEVLGRRTTIFPPGLRFDSWRDSALHALGTQYTKQRSVGLTHESRDRAVWTAFAEEWNGLGYRHASHPTPFVYSGTNRYTSGKYIADGQYDAGVVDRQPGCAVLWAAALDGIDLARNPPPGRQPVPRLLARGARGPDVRSMQLDLIATGKRIAVDGIFGPGTESAVRTFQRLQGLSVDGIVGPHTRAAMARVARDR